MTSQVSSPVNPVHDFNPLVKNFLDSNKLLIINYYLCCDVDISDEERNILLFLKQKWSQKLIRINEDEDYEREREYNYNKPSRAGNINVETDSEENSGDSSLNLDNIMNENKKENKNKKKKRSRSPKKITNCPHTEKNHYAKNMCYNCYHSKGRNKRAWKCEHNNKMHYAKGLCQNCYHSLYKIKKPEEIKKKEKFIQNIRNIQNGQENNQIDGDLIN